MRIRRVRGSFVVIGVAAGVAVAASGRAAAPSGRYQMTGSTVLDTKTGLTWQQSVPATTYTQSGAASYCSSLGSGWRLPTMKELVTIVDPTTANPSIDGTAFPNTLASYFWTSTPFAAASGYAWIVYFSYGYTETNSVSATDLVRCVH